MALLLVLAASLFRDFRNVVAGTAGRGLCAGFGGACRDLRRSAPTSPVSAWHAPLIALSTGNVVVFWLFTRALFDDALQAALVARAGLGRGRGFQLCQLHVDRAGVGDARLSIIAINLVVLGFIALAVAQTITSWSADLVEGRRRVRVFIVAAAALYGGINAVLQILMSGSGAAEIANTVNAAVLAGIVAAICIRDDAGRRWRTVSGRGGSRAAAHVAARRSRGCRRPETGRRA